MKSTLYVRGLPSRPHNNDNYIKLLLKYFNSNNNYVKMVNEPLPTPKFNALQDTQIEMLDETLGIVSISRSQTKRLSKKCFITFNNIENASTFKKKYNNTKVLGRTITIKYAKKDSLISLYLEKPQVLKKVLATRNKQKSKTEDPLNIKRKLRRLRNKLRGKGINDPNELKAITKQYKKKLYDDIGKEKPLGATDSKPEGESRQQVRIPKESTEKIQKSKKTKLANVLENPPNSVLLVQNLPNDTTEDTLNKIFGPVGLVEIRLVKIRHLAFIEYDSIMSAKNVLKRLGPAHSIENADQEILIGYAK